MRNYMIVLLVVVVTSVVVFDNGCKSEKTLVVEYFPVDVGNWWEYEYRFRVVVYDTVSHDTSESLFIDSLHDEIEGTDPVAGWQCYRFHETLNYGTRWLAHPDTALLFIASLINTSRRAIDKIAGDPFLTFYGNTFRSPDELAVYFRCLILGVPWNSDVDTFYLTPPQKLYIYPLNIGTAWVRMTDPWIEEREVVVAESVTVSVGTFYALKVQVTTEWEDDYQRFIWITEEGMIKDSIYLRGFAWNAIDDTIGYVDAYTIYELISYNLE